MRKILLLLATVILPLLLPAQKQIKIDVSIDQFTKDTVIQSDWFYISNAVWKGFPSFAKIRSENGSMTIRIKAITGKSVSVIPEGSKVMFKFKDESLLELNTAKTAVASVGGGSVGIRGSSLLGVDFPCHLSLFQLKKLSQNTVEAMRVYHDDGFIEFPFEKEKFKTAFKDNMNAYYMNYVANNRSNNNSE